MLGYGQIPLSAGSGPFIGRTLKVRNGSIILAVRQAR